MSGHKKNVKAKKNKYITFKVMRQDNAIHKFYLKKHKPLREFMQTYCDREGFHPASVRFLFDGFRINEDDTPSSIGLEEGDVIEVYEPLIGG